MCTLIGTQSRLKACLSLLFIDACPLSWGVTVLTMLHKDVQERHEAGKKELISIYKNILRKLEKCGLQQRISQLQQITIYLPYHITYVNIKV